MADSRRAFLRSIGPLAAAGSNLSAQQSGAAVNTAGESSQGPPQGMVLRMDERVESLLPYQITDAASLDAGGYPDQWEIVTPQSGSGVIAAFATAFVCPRSRFYRDAELPRRIRLAARFLDRKQLPSGNIDLLTTNFDSPPDTGFVVHNVAPAAILLRRGGEAGLAADLMPFLRKAGAAMAVGGVHTPNHRWVVSAALALIHHLEPRSEYARRAEQWLAEGIDIDEDGLYTERSPLVYSPVVNRSLIYMAEFLGKPALLEPVRRNLEAALFLMHPNGELETGLSGRQDQNTVGSMGVNWLGLQTIAVRDSNPVFAYLARQFENEFGDLGQWMLLPTLRGRAGNGQSPPASYHKVFRNVHLHRIRTGSWSTSVFAQGNDRVFSIRNGDAVVEAVRFASAFFGKGQFIPASFATGESTIEMMQALSGPYYQPLDPPETVPSAPGLWAASRGRRRQSEIGKLTQRLIVRQLGNRFELEVIAEGTPNVPVAVEISLRAGSAIENVRTAPASADSYLTTGSPVFVRQGSDRIRIEAGASRHAYTQLRGALPKLPGPGVYLTGFSPFREKITFGE